MADSPSPPNGNGRGRRARRAARRGGVVAIVGIHGVAARRLVRRLEEDDRYERLVLIDVRAPSMPVRRSVFYQVDLVEPLADAALADVLRTEATETVVHLAMREYPIPLAEGAHELESVGTMMLLNALADCLSRGTPLRKLVTVTTAMVYGANPDNPNYLTEEHPLRGGGQSSFVKDKVDVEGQIAEFRSVANLPVCILRPCWTVGEGTSIAVRLLRQSPVFTIMGFDPLMQVLHVEDLGDVLKRAIDRTFDGAFNVAPRGVMPLSAMLRISHRLSVPLPSPVAYPVAELLWRSYGIGVGVSLDFLRYLWVVDGDRTFSEFELSPRYTTREAVESFTGAG
jgi:UDP-glucose 4-epimerase